MRVSGVFFHGQQFSWREERAQADPDPGQRVRPALLTVDHADRVPDDEPGRPQRLDRLRERAPGGDDVLDQAEQLALLEGPLDPVSRPVRLRLVAHDHEREAARERRGRG